MKLTKKFILIVLLSFPFNTIFTMHRKKKDIQGWREKIFQLQKQQQKQQKQQKQKKIRDTKKKGYCFNSRSIVSKEVQKLLQFMTEQSSQSGNEQQCLWCKGKYTKLKTHLLRMIIKPAWCTHCDLGVDAHAEIIGKNATPCNRHSYMHNVVRRQISPEEIATLRKLYVDAADKTGLNHLKDIRKLPLFTTTYNTLFPPPPNKCSIDFITNH